MLTWKIQEGCRLKTLARMGLSCQESSPVAGARSVRPARASCLRCGRGGGDRRTCTKKQPTIRLKTSTSVQCIYTSALQALHEGRGVSSVAESKKAWPGSCSKAPVQVPWSPWPLVSLHLAGSYFHVFNVGCGAKGPVLSLLIENSSPKVSKSFIFDLSSITRSC
jgi:hypothetical protein